MPATYAHHRFGQICLEKMPEKLKKICEKNRALFDFGVHGPDLMFYYGPLSANEVNRHGNELHRWTGKQLFEIFRYVYNGMPLEGGAQLKLSPSEKQGMLAYMLGFLCHFTLDSCCHSYINGKTAETVLSHNAIESQYEAFLMRMDGKDPLKVDRSRPLKPARDGAELVAQLFPFDGERLYKSMQGQKTVVRLLYSPSGFVKKAARLVLRLLKMNPEFGDLFLDEKIHPICVITNEEIYARQRKAEELYPELLSQFVRYLYGRGELGEHFRYDFEGEITRDE